MSAITVEIVQAQILGLQRTQSEECWIRKDIFYHILGAAADQYIAQSVAMNETPTKAKNLVQAMRQKKAPPSDNYTLVCIDRAPALEAILQAVAKKASSPGKSQGGEK